MLYKKRHSEPEQNEKSGGVLLYSPIALTNCLYKIYTSMIKKRLADALDGRLQKDTIWLQKREINGGCNTLCKKVFRTRGTDDKQEHCSAARLGKSLRQSRQMSYVQSNGEDEY